MYSFIRLFFFFFFLCVHNFHSSYNSASMPTFTSDTTNWRRKFVFWNCLECKKNSQMFFFSPFDYWIYCLFRCHHTRKVSRFAIIMSSSIELVCIRITVERKKSQNSPKMKPTLLREHKALECQKRTKKIERERSEMRIWKIYIRYWRHTNWIIQKWICRLCVFTPNTVHDWKMDTIKYKNRNIIRT